MSLGEEGRLDTPCAPRESELEQGKQFQETLLTPIISLVVCTRNRARSLAKCLSAIRQIEFDPRAWELVITDNASTDETSMVIRNFLKTVPFKVAVINEGRKGKSYALNSAIEAASAPLIAFTDDDCYVERDFLDQIIAAFNNPDYGYIGGRVLLHDPLDAAVTIKEDSEGEEYPAPCCLIPGAINGANMAVRREALRAVGGFDPLFGPGGRLVAEEVDLLSRISCAGWKGAYIAGPTVRHHHGRKPGRDVAKLTRTYARGSGAYYVKGCLRRSTRPLFLKNFYWFVVRLLKRGQFRALFQVSTGAAEYVVRVTAMRLKGAS